MFFEGWSNINYLDDPAQYYCMDLVGDITVSSISMWSYMQRYLDDTTDGYYIDLILSFPSLLDIIDSMFKFRAQCDTQEDSSSIKKWRFKLKQNADSSD